MDLLQMIQVSICPVWNVETYDALCWTIDNMLQLLISAGILSFGWGALYQVSRLNCSVCLLAAKSLEPPYVPRAGQRRGILGETVISNPLESTDRCTDPKVESGIGMPWTAWRYEMNLFAFVDRRCIDKFYMSGSLFPLPRTDILPQIMRIFIWNIF